MTSAVERDALDLVAALGDAISVDAPYLAEVAQRVRAATLELDVDADRLADMARRWRRALDRIEILRSRDLLDDTQTMLLDDLGGGG